MEAYNKVNDTLIQVVAQLGAFTFTKRVKQLTMKTLAGRKRRRGKEGERKKTYYGRGPKVYSARVCCAAALFGIMKSFFSLSLSLWAENGK